MEGGGKEEEEEKGREQREGGRGMWVEQAQNWLLLLVGIGREKRKLNITSRIRRVASRSPVAVRPTFRGEQEQQTEVCPWARQSQTRPSVESPLDLR